MTPRERFVETLCFGAPDRIPFSPGLPRESTLRTWHAQGLAEGGDYLALIYEQIDRRRDRSRLAPVELRPSQNEIDLGVSFQMIPTFEERVLEHKEGHYVVQDWMGAVTEISDEFDYTYIRAPRDFVTRKWHRFPVQSRDDWEDRIKWRFDPKDARRFPPDFETRCRKLRDRDYPLIVSINGPFWQLREFVGFEGLCALVLEDPEFVRAMTQFWKEFVSEVLEQILPYVVPDMLHFSEDMAFKEHPMISPEMTKEFFSSVYRQWIEIAKGSGVPIFAVDSDGRVDSLIPVWVNCGINCVDPVEVAAGNDIVAMRAAFGKTLSFCGGIDNRAMAAGGATLEAELARVRPAVDDGGFIPSCDHGVPSDVSWSNFQEYAMKLAEITGWLR